MPEGNISGNNEFLSEQVETMSQWKTNPQARKTQRLLGHTLVTLQTINSTSLNTNFEDFVRIFTGTAVYIYPQTV